MITVPLSQTTIPHEVTSVYGASLVMMRPAPQGTGVIAGGAVRAVVELAGIKDIVTKIRRSTNPVNSAKAALKGLETLQDPERALMRRRQVAQGGLPGGDDGDGTGTG
jgi:small subunit ribosomal protein S5